MHKVSLTCFYMLRGCYLLMFIGLTTQFVPELFGQIEKLPVMDGVVTAMLGALGIVSALGLLAPVRMLPLLLFELAWKVIWTLSVALPRWNQGRFDQDVADILFACIFAAPFIFIIPWRYMAEAYLLSPSSWKARE